MNQAESNRVRQVQSRVKSSPAWTKQSQIKSSKYHAVGKGPCFYPINGLPCYSVMIVTCSLSFSVLDPYYFSFQHPTASLCICYSFFTTTAWGLVWSRSLTLNQFCAFHQPKNRLSARKTSEWHQHFADLEPRTTYVGGWGWDYHKQLNLSPPSLPGKRTSIKWLNDVALWWLSCLWKSKPVLRFTSWTNSQQPCSELRFRIQLVLCDYLVSGFKFCVSRLPRICLVM